MAKKYVKMHPIVNGEKDTTTDIYPQVVADTINSESATSGQVLTADGNGGSSFQTPQSGSTTYASLTDVDVSSVANADVMKWDSTQSKWKPDALAAVAVSNDYDDLNDKPIINADLSSISGQEINQVYRHTGTTTSSFTQHKLYTYNGTSWSEIGAGGSGSSTDAQLNGVSYTSNNVANLTTALLTPVVQGIIGGDYITSTDDITKLNYKPGNYFSTGGDFLNTFGLQLAQGVGITQYFASLGNDALPFVFNFNLSSIPSGITSFSVNIYINSAFKSTKTVTITDGVGTVSYNYSPNSLSTIVKLELADSNLDGAILDSMSVTLATGQSVLCFNKPAERHFATSKVSSQNLFVLTSQTSNVAKFGINRTSVNFNIDSYSTKNTITLTGINVQRARVYPQMQAGSASLAYNVLVIGNSTNTLYFLTADSSLTLNNDMVTGSSDVIDAYVTNQASSGNAVKVCGTTASLTPFIANTTSISTLETLTLNGTDLPSEFVDCCPVDDGFLYSRSANQETGYVLTHKTGRILYFPSQNSTYCIDIGVGSNATAMLRETASVKQIKIYFAQGNCVMKCLLEWNSTTNKWEKVGIYKYYQNYEYVLDYSYTTSDATMCKNKTTRAWSKST